MALTSKLSAIGDAIRSKTGGTELLTLDEMPGEIEGIQTGGGGDDLADYFNKTLVEYSSSKIASLSNYGMFQAFKSLVSISLPEVTAIGNSCFAACYALESAYIPKAQTIGTQAFNDCRVLSGDLSLPNLASAGDSCFHKTKIESVDFPVIGSIAAAMFSNCSKLKSANITQATSIGASGFKNCTSLEKISLPSVTNLATLAFDGCSKLNAVVLGASSVCTMNAVAALQKTPIASGTGYIYVPDALVEDYKAATNWSTYASQIKPLSEYAG